MDGKSCPSAQMADVDWPKDVFPRHAIGPSADLVRTIVHYLGVSLVLPIASTPNPWRGGLGYCIRWHTVPLKGTEEARCSWVPFVECGARLRAPLTKVAQLVYRIRRKLVYIGKESNNACEPVLDVKYWSNWFF